MTTTAKVKPKSKFTFINRRDENNAFDNKDTIVHSDEITLSDILEDFRLFLAGCGYQVNGNLVLEEDQDDNK